MEYIRKYGETFRDNQLRTVEAPEGYYALQEEFIRAQKSQPTPLKTNISFFEKIISFIKQARIPFIILLSLILFYLFPKIVY